MICRMTKRSEIRLRMLTVSLGVILLPALMYGSEAFSTAGIITRSGSYPTLSSSTSSLLMAQKGGAKPNKKKKNGGTTAGKNKSKGKVKRKDSWGGSNSGSIKADNTAGLNIPSQKQGSTSSRGAQPPWQVMSKKDQKKNAFALKEQRKLQNSATTLQQQALPAPPLQQQLSYSADMSTSNTLLSSPMRSLLAWKRFKPSNANRDLTFVGSYLHDRTPPRLGVPEVAFLGRSNVGKSSLLNRMVNSEIARVGKTPGATASVNLYAFTRNSKPLLGLVDLPGFGYAKLSRAVKDAVEVAAERYLSRRTELSLGILLVDSRRSKPSDDDRAVLAALYDMGVPLCVVATKVDKLGSDRERKASLESIREGLGLPEGQPLAVSSVTGEGVRELWRVLLDACEDKVTEWQGNQEEDDDEEEEDDWWTDDEGGEDGAVFQDGEDLVYDQGYDWVHASGSSVMLENDGTSFDSAAVGENNADDDSGDEDFNSDESDYELSPESRQKMLRNEESQAMANDAMKLRNLKKIARRMERRNEF